MAEAATADELPDWLTVDEEPEEAPEQEGQEGHPPVCVCPELLGWVVVVDVVVDDDCV